MPQGLWLSQGSTENRCVLPRARSTFATTNLLRRLGASSATYAVRGSDSNRCATRVGQTSFTYRWRCSSLLWTKRPMPTAASTNAPNGPLITSTDPIGRPCSPSAGGINAFKGILARGPRAIEAARPHRIRRSSAPSRSPRLAAAIVEFGARPDAPNRLATAGGASQLYSWPWGRAASAASAPPSCASAAAHATSWLASSTAKATPLPRPTLASRPEAKH